ncbi:MAG: pyrrolo-quinoline quinone [Clostridia bacterium]|nr:pyrrolo-quinoline quinone [Clostridia bacterium]
MERKRKKRRKLVIHPKFYAVLALGLLLIAAVVLLIILLISALNGNCSGESEVEATAIPTATPTPEPTPTPAPTPHAVGASEPSNYGYIGVIEVDGTETSTFLPLQRLSSTSVTNLSTLWKGMLSETRISFPEGENYTELAGITTFRGDNYRSGGAYGTASITEQTLTEVWSNPLGSLPRNNSDREWTGSGWTGQPLIVQWPDEVRQIMNLYDWAKQTEGLVEVIFPTMDGKVHFYELSSGRETRDALDIGMPFKGTGSIDPRGYPILYLGSGDQYDDESRKARAMIYSLVDFTKLYEFGVQGTDSFAKRVFYAYDSAPLIDAETDTLIYPGENGVLYTMKLNSSFDGTTVSVNPTNIVKLRYDGTRSSTGITEGTDLYWLGYEGSAAAWNGFLYLSSNDGLFQCINLTTMETVWIADTLDDTNGSPVLDVISDSEAYLYVGTSLHFTKDTSTGRGVAPFFKINALTGEIVQQYGLTVYTEAGVSGGIQATAALGRNDMEGLVLITIARYPDHSQGVLVALDKESFEVRWTFSMDYYSWSSPVIVYTPEGKGYVLQADSAGSLFLLDGVSGTLLNTLKLDNSNFEASPAVFNNILVIGSRGQKVFGVRIS